MNGTPKIGHTRLFRVTLAEVNQQRSERSDVSMKKTGNRSTIKHHAFGTLRPFSIDKSYSTSIDWMGEKVQLTVDGEPGKVLPTLDAISALIYDQVAWNKDVRESLLRDVKSKGLFLTDSQRIANQIAKSAKLSWISAKQYSSTVTGIMFYFDSDHPVMQGASPFYFIVSMTCKLGRELNDVRVEGGD